MKRTRNPLSVTLKGYLLYNTGTGYNEITHQETTYHLSLQQTVRLEQYFHNDDAATLEHWYNSLNEEEKKKVVRYGMQENVE